eukprot:4057900-Pyramimonas_sp.AAC.1
MQKAHNEECLPRVRDRSRHGLGPPDTFNLTAACSTLVETASAEVKGELTEHLAKFKPGSREAQHM